MSCTDSMVSKRDDANVLVTQPHGLAEAFKRLAAERSDILGTTNRRRVWAQDLHEEAVRMLLDRLKRGEKVVFVATPFWRHVRKTMWFDRALVTEVREVAARYNVSVASVVLTACLAYLEAQDVKLD